MLALLFFPVALHFLMHSTTAQNSEITCPATGFTVGVNATVTCKVKKADFVSACTLAATLINFYFTPSNGAKSEWCSSSYKTCPNTGTTQVACGTCSCGCETDDGTFLIHRLDFIPTLAHAAGNFSCEVICVNTGNLPTLANNDCDQVKVATPTMPPTTETTASPSSPGQDCPICKKGTDCDEPDLICLLFLLLLIPIAVVIIIVWYCFCHNGGINGNKKAKEVELKSSPQDQQTSIGNNLADGNVSGQRDNKVGTGHVATNGALNRERFSKPVQETELTKVQETSSAPSGVKKTSPNGSVRPLPMPKVPVAAPSPRLPPLHSSTPMTSVERNSQVLDVPHKPRPLPLPGIKSTKM